MKLLTALSVLLLLVTACSMGGISGGSEIGNPRMIACAGVISDDAGPVEGLTVYLYEADANPTKEEPYATTLTNMDGIYHFPEVLSHSHYRVFSSANIVRNNCSHMAYLDTLIPENDTVLEALLLEIPATLTITDPVLTYTHGTVLYAAGIPVSYDVSADTMIIKLPAGAVDLFQFNPTTDTLVPGGINYREMKLTTGDDITVTETIITPLNAPTGPGSGLTTDNLTFTVSPATNSLNHEMEYRFAWLNYDTAIVKVSSSDYWDEATIGDWGDETSITLNFPTVGKHKVRAQVRSTVDSTIISEWSYYASAQITSP